MRLLPLVSLVNKSEAAKSYAILEGLLFIPLFAFLAAFCLSKTDITFDVRMAIVSFLGIVLVGTYARFASS